MTKLPIGPLLTSVILSLATIAPALAPAAPQVPESPNRPPDQTFLTYPEWFLVFSPDERARYLESGRPPSRFPYLGHVRELWDGYGAVREAIGGYPFNAGYHAMIVVIATSTTLEYGLQAAYETVVGRAFEALPGGPVPEETFAAEGARAYVEFIKVRPWYEFDFTHWLRALWRLPLALSSTLPRALERRFWLTTEYAGKALYGAAIAKATAAAYDPAVPTTRIVVDALPAGIEQDLPHLERLAGASEGVTADVPRYQEFTRYARTLASAGVTFLRIAGNEGPIALTVIAPAEWAPAAGAPYRPLFDQPILTDPSHARVLLVTDVSQLSTTLTALERAGVEIEHVFDY